MNPADLYGHPEPIAHFSWLGYAVIAAAYTLMTFTSVGFRSAMVFSRRNAIAAATVFNGHVRFLLALLALIWSIALLYPILPLWIKDMWIQSRSGTHESSILDILFLLAMFCLYLLERPMIYKESEPEGDTQ
jgi:hypothetical protein